MRTSAPPDFNKTLAYCAEIPEPVNQKSRPARQAFPLDRQGCSPHPAPAHASSPLHQPQKGLRSCLHECCSGWATRPLPPHSAPEKLQVDDGQAGPGREPHSLGHGGGCVQSSCSTLGPTASFVLCSALYPVSTDTRQDGHCPAGLRGEGRTRGPGCGGDAPSGWQEGPGFVSHTLRRH